MLSNVLLKYILGYSVVWELIYDKYIEIFYIIATMPFVPMYPRQSLRVGVAGLLFFLCRFAFLEYFVNSPENIFPQWYSSGEGCAYCNLYRQQHCDDVNWGEILSSP